jgi:hypothetical protein
VRDFGNQEMARVSVGWVERRSELELFLRWRGDKIRLDLFKVRGYIT